jgi:hypothetical protein
MELLARTWLLLPLWALEIRLPRGIEVGNSPTDSMSQYFDICPNANLYQLGMILSAMTRSTFRSAASGVRSLARSLS